MDTAKIVKRNIWFVIILLYVYPYHLYPIVVGNGQAVVPSLASVTPEHFQIWTRFVLASFAALIAVVNSPRTLILTIMVVYQAVSLQLSLMESPVSQSIDLALQKKIADVCIVLTFVGISYLAIFSRTEPTRAEKLRNRLVEFYKVHNPERIAHVDDILKKYAGNENLLFLRLRKKYETKSQDKSDSEHRREVNSVDQLEEEVHDDTVVDQNESPEVSDEEEFEEEVLEVEQLVVEDAETIIKEETESEEEVEEEEEEEEPVQKAAVDKTPVKKVAPPSSFATPPSTKAAPRSATPASVNKAALDAQAAIAARTEERIRQLSARKKK